MTYIWQVEILLHCGVEYSGEFESECGCSKDVFDELMSDTDGGPCEFVSFYNRMDQQLIYVARDQISALCLTPPAMLREYIGIVN